MTHSGISEQILAQGVQALEAIAARRMGLDDWLDRRADSRLRRSLSSLLFTFFRKKRAIDTALAQCWRQLPRPEVVYLLELGLTLGCFQDAVRPESAVNIAVDTAKRRFGPVAGKFVNAVLRRALTEVKTDALPGALLPEALATRWRNQFGAAECSRMAALFQERFPAVVRWRRGFVAEALPEVEPLALPWASDWPFGSCAHPEKILTTELFARGAFYFQDPAPSAVVMMLAQAAWPETVRAIDLCAAPGGKLLLASEFLAARGIAVEEFVAVDRSAVRQRLTEENLARCRVSAAVIAADAAEYRPADDRGFDLVLADVPCSNTGVFRRRPDALWRWDETMQAALTGVQRAILNNAARLCNPGGVLLYSTCSLEPEENQERTAAFLAAHSEFRLLNQHLWLPDASHDGTFGALFCRQGRGQLS